MCVWVCVCVCVCICLGVTAPRGPHPEAISRPASHNGSHSFNAGSDQAILANMIWAHSPLCRVMVLTPEMGEAFPILWNEFSGWIMQVNDAVAMQQCLF